MHLAGAPATASSLQQLPRQCLPSIPPTPDSPFSPSSIQGKAALRQVHPLLSFPLSSAPSIEPLPPAPTHAPGARCSPVPTRGLCLRGWEGLQLPGAGWPPTQGCAVAGGAVPALVPLGSPVFRGPLPRACGSLPPGQWLRAHGASGDAVAGLAAVNGLSILQTLPSVPRWKAGSSYLEGRRRA